jgi:hypothetical protein
MGVGTVAILILGLLAFWVVGGVALRVAGAGISLLALVGLAVSSGAATGFFILVFGLFLWLAGHWHFALRHHAYKSPLARRIFLLVLPGRLGPTRDWGIPTIDRDPRIDPDRR